MLNFELKTYLPIRLVLCTEYEMMLIQKEKNMTKVEANDNIYYYEVSIKPNIEIIGISVYLRKQHNFEPYLLLMISLKLKMSLGRYLCIEKENFIWG